MKMRTRSKTEMTEKSLLWLMLLQKGLGHWLAELKSGAKQFYVLVLALLLTVLYL